MKSLHNLGLEVQVQEASATFTRLLWQCSQHALGSQLGVPARLSCGLLTLLQLRFDAVHSSSELEV
jgi:hypothetical protein